jgi:hypothetical protein
MSGRAGSKILFLSSGAKHLPERPFVEFILSVVEGLRVTTLVCWSLAMGFNVTPSHTRESGGW